MAKKDKHFEEIIKEAEGIIDKPKKNKGSKVKKGRIATPTHEINEEVNIDIELENLENHFFPKNAVVEDEPFILNSLSDDTVIDDTMFNVEEEHAAVLTAILKLRGDFLEAENNKKKLAKVKKKFIDQYMKELSQTEKFKADNPTDENLAELRDIIKSFTDTEDFMESVYETIKSQDFADAVAETREVETAAPTNDVEEEESVFLLSKGGRTVFSGDVEDELVERFDPPMEEILARPKMKYEASLQRYHAMVDELKMPC